MMEYHVLSNNSMISILFYGVIGGLALGAIFSYLGQRDSSIVTKEKGIIRKAIPWIILCIFLSELSLLLYRYVDYPWDVEPQPSQASVFREMNYLGSGYPLWGWANDYQLPIVSVLAGSVMWLCWTVYAFNFKPSNTSWWKKICKVFAYSILSATILGFYIHELRDIWLYVGVTVIIIILLWLAKVSPKESLSPYKEILITSKEETPLVYEQKDNEDPLRFMPKSSVVLQLEPKEELETPSINEPTVSESESPSVSQENVIPLQIFEDVVETKDEVTDLSQQSVDSMVDIEMMYCKHCGKRIEADSTFCKYCGKRVK